VFHELNVPLKHPVDLCRGANTIIEPQPFCVGLARWATPRLIASSSITIGVAHVESTQFFLGLPFFPTRFSAADDEEVRGVQHPHPLPRDALIIQLDCRRLIEILEDSSVMFHLVDPSPRAAMDPTTECDRSSSTLVPECSGFGTMPTSHLAPAQWPPPELDGKQLRP